jgi:hypothetical protein
MLEHDPEKACTRAGGCGCRFSEKICSNKALEGDGDSTFFIAR